MAGVKMNRYSQNDEQDVILREFEGFTGKFLDIGANDGITLSNTYALSLLDWVGICVEPSPSSFPKLSKLYENNNNIVSCKAALADYDGEIVFYDSDGEGVSSTVKGNVEKYGCKATEVVVDCVSSERLFNSIGYDFDFISLDVELTNVQVLKSLPFDKLTKLKLICVEHDSKQQEIKDFLKPFGFEEIHRTGENIILKRVG